MMYLSTQEAAGRLGLTCSRVRQLLGSGILPSIRIGKTWGVNPVHLPQIRRILDDCPPGRQYRPLLEFTMFKKCGVGELSGGALVRVGDALHWYAGRTAIEAVADIIPGEFEPDTLEVRLQAVEDDIREDDIENPPGWTQMLRYALTAHARPGGLAREVSDEDRDRRPCR